MRIFPHFFFLICGSLGDFFLGLAEAGNLMNVHFFLAYRTFKGGIYFVMVLPKRASYENINTFTVCLTFLHAKINSNH